MTLPLIYWCNITDEQAARSASVLALTESFCVITARSSLQKFTHSFRCLQGSFCSSITALGGDDATAEIASGK